MKEYTAKEMKQLKANPYTFKVTKHKLYFSIEFKEAFWTKYQAGVGPRKIVEELGYDLSILGQKQIDSITQRIKYQALSPMGFRQGESRSRRGKNELLIPTEQAADEQPALSALINEVKYLRQELEFLKKIIKTKNTATRKSS